MTEDFVELTPTQAWSLIFAWQAEQNRQRHTDEPWPTQAARDVETRQWRINEAVKKGVPLNQAEHFVFSGPMPKGDAA